MPTVEPIDLAARLGEMAAQLFRQGRHPALCAMDALDLRGAAKELRRLREEAEELKAANGGLRAENSELLEAGMWALARLHADGIDSGGLGPVVARYAPPGWNAREMD